MKDPDNASYTTVLRRLRQVRGLSQERLARLSGVSRPTIHRLEHGRRRPHKSTIIKLAEALDVEPKDLAPDLFVGVETATIGVELTARILAEAAPFIRKAARGRALNNSDVEELVAAGYEGLYEACRKYDPGRGVPFDRYARWLAICRVKDEARRLYRKHPGYGLEAQGFEPWTY